MIQTDTINKITLIFTQMQVCTLTSPQIYDPSQEYRTLCLFFIPAPYGNAREAYVNVKKDALRPWHYKTWERLKKKIPHESYIKELDNGIIRFGFA